MPASAITSAQLILNILRPDQTPTTWESDRLRAGADWDDLAVRAIVFGLAPQLYRRLVEWQLPVPSRSLAKLAATYQATAKRNAAIHDQLGEALRAFAAQDLRPIALKGVHLAELVYPDPALRPMNDIDLLFAPHELPKAEAVLVSLGYGGKHKSAELGAGVTKHTSTFQRDSAGAATPNPYLSTESERMIEPHSSLEESWFGLNVDMTPGVGERAIETTLAGQPCRVLATEDLLLHLCIHFCFHLIMGAPSMVQLTDLLALVSGQNSRTASTRFNDETFVGVALERRAAPYALAALTLAQKLLGVPLPASTLNSLSQATPTPLRHRIAALGLPDVLRRTQQKPLTSILQRLRRGLADRAETANWAPDWRGRWQVWQTAFDITKTDTGRLLLGQSLKSQIPNSKSQLPTN